MLNRKFGTIAAAVLLSISVNLVVFAATRTTTIYVNGMTCGGCAISIEQVLKNTEGVEDVRVNFERGEAVVKYDDRKVTAMKLREVVNSIGYRATARPSKRGRTLKTKTSSCCSATSCDTSSAP